MNITWKAAQLSSIHYPDEWIFHNTRTCIHGQWMNDEDKWEFQTWAHERAHSCWSSYVNYRNVKLQTTYKTQNGEKLSKIKTKHITNKKLAIFTYLFIHSFIHSLIYSIQLLKSWPSEWKLLTTSYHSSSSTKKIQRVLP